MKSYFLILSITNDIKIIGFFRKKMRHQLYKKQSLSSDLHQSGAVAIIVAIMMTMILGVTALAIDVGYAMTTKNELQNIADAAALSGTRTLGRLYECNKNIETCTGPMPAAEQKTYIVDEAAIKAAVRTIALGNSAGGLKSIVIKDDDVVIGTWNSDTRTLTPTLTSADAVQVTARRDTDANNPLSTFFTGLMGIDTINVSAVATAALTGLGSKEMGGLPLPLAINKKWMSTLPCNNNLTLYPSSATVCAAWHSFDDSNPYGSNANDIEKMIEDMTAIPPLYKSPETSTSTSELHFINGTAAGLFKNDEPVLKLFDSMKVRNDNIYDFDTDSSTWTTTVPVYEDEKADCNPTGTVKVVGFTKIVITGVTGPPNPTVLATISCGVESGRGAGEALVPRVPYLAL